MTKEEILAMQPGPELDDLVARHVMNLDDTNFQYDVEMGISERIKHNDFLDEDIWVSFNPSTDISAAWEVVEAMRYREKNGAFIDVRTGSDFYEVEAHGVKDWHVSHPSLPLAICRVALLTVMEEVAHERSEASSAPAART